MICSEMVGLVEDVNLVFLAGAELPEQELGHVVLHLRDAVVSHGTPARLDEWSKEHSGFGLPCA